MTTDQLVLFLLGKCYDRLHRQKRPLFLCDLAIVSTEWNEVLASICNTYTLRVNIPGCVENAFCREFNAGLLCTLLQGMIDVYQFDEQELSILLFCRLCYTLKWIKGGNTSSFLERQELLNSLKEAKVWIIDLLNVSLDPPQKVFFSRENLQKSMSTFLGAHGLLSTDCSIKLADFLITAACCQKEIYFLPQNYHAKTVYHCLDPSKTLSNDPVVFEQAICLPFSFSVDYLNLYDSSSNPGNIILFSCSLELETSALREFIELLELVNVSYLASQKVLGVSVKEALFDIGILPLERLSLCHTDALQCATGATPFHSLYEFVSWVKALEHEAEDSKKHLGFVRKVVILTDKSILWLYGDKNVATVVLPVKSIVFNKAVVNVCERTLFYARQSIGSANNLFLEGQPACALFIAEYLHQRCVLGGFWSGCFREVIDIVHQTLLYRALNCKPMLSSDLLEYTKVVAGHAAMSACKSLSFETKERCVILADINYHFLRTVEVVAEVLDSVSLMVQVGRG